MEETKALKISELLEALHEMQLQVEEAIPLLIKERESAQKSIEEAPPGFNETPTLVQDTKKIDSLTAEVEHLKALLLLESQSTDAVKKAYAEALDRNAELVKKLEDSETRVDQPQDSVQRLEEKFSNIESENQTGDPHFEGRGSICYSRDQLLRVREAVEFPEDILKIKQELDTVFYVEDQNFGHSDANSGGEFIKVLPERAGWRECKFYLTAEGCKYGSTCLFSHHGHDQKKTETGHVELHFSGLQLRPAPVNPLASNLSRPTAHTDIPINWPSVSNASATLEGSLLHQQAEMREYPQRPGEPVCSYFNKHGTCKFKYVCKFHHPSPETWRTLTTKADGRVHQEQMQEYPDRPAWSGLARMADVPIHRQGRMEYPERPGEPECTYFMKFGSCKFRDACIYHHPNDRLPRVPSCIISPSGLPLRHDQPICSHYSRFGMCKFGPLCKFDHPMDNGSSAPAAHSRSGQGAPEDESEWWIRR